MINHENMVSITAGQFYELLVTLVKYWFTQIFVLVIFNWYLTDTNQYILETNISKIN